MLKVFSDGNSYDCKKSSVYGANGDISDSIGDRYITNAKRVAFTKWARILAIVLMMEMLWLLKS